MPMMDEGATRTFSTVSSGNGAPCKACGKGLGAPGGIRPRRTSAAKTPPGRNPMKHAKGSVGMESPVSCLLAAMGCTINVGLIDNHHRDHRGSTVTKDRSTRGEELRAQDEISLPSTNGALSWAGIAELGLRTTSSTTILAWQEATPNWSKES